MTASEMKRPGYLSSAFLTPANRARLEARHDYRAARVALNGAIERKVFLPVDFGWEKAPLREQDVSVFHHAGFQAAYGGVSALDMRRNRDIFRQESLEDCFGIKETAFNTARMTAMTRFLSRQEDGSVSFGEALRTFQDISVAARQEFERVNGKPPEDMNLCAGRDKPAAIIRTLARGPSFPRRTGSPPLRPAAPL